jgi:hypothetical protein
MKTRLRRLQSVALSLVLAGVVTARAGAEVQLSGTQDKVVLRANNATIGEILTGIQSTFNIRVQLTGSTARQFSGAYAGSLRRVLSRLLDGEDFIISSAADDVTVVLLNRKGGAPIAPKVAKLPSAASPPAQRAGAEQPVKVAAVGDEGNNPVQGWTGSGAPFATRTATATPAASVQSNAAHAPEPVKLAAGGDDENNPVQGWTGSGVQFATPASAATPAAPANPADSAKPQSGDTDGNPNVQGWEPTGNPVKDLSAKEAPVVDNAAAPSMTDKDEGNPNFQGYMPDWTPPEPGKSTLDSMPMLPGAPIGVRRQ